MRKYLFSHCLTFLCLGTIKPWLIQTSLHSKWLLIIQVLLYTCINPYLWFHYHFPSLFPYGYCFPYKCSLCKCNFNCFSSLCMIMVTLFPYGYGLASLMHFSSKNLWSSTLYGFMHASLFYGLLFYNPMQSNFLLKVMFQYFIRILPLTLMIIKAREKICNFHTFSF